MPPIVLDLDASVGPLAERVVVPLRQCEDALRFACSTRALALLARTLDEQLPDEYDTVFTGSGDFHHLSLPLIRRAAARHGSLQLVVFDNHPDNMRFPFGVHCGSWVARAAALPGVIHVHVVGITSADIGLAHAWENRLRPLRAGRLTYWSCGVRTRWAEHFGMAGAFRSFESIASLLDAFLGSMASTTQPIYLSIDKDVLSAEDAHTNWDQGRMREAELVSAIHAVRQRIVASDITGEVSQANYKQWWKRALSALDRQPPIPENQLAEWQTEQHALNVRLLAAIEG